MLPPFGEEGCSANEYAEFQSQLNHMLKKEDCSANEHAGFQSQLNHILKKKATQPMSMQDSSHN